MIANLAIPMGPHPVPTMFAYVCQPVPQGQFWEPIDHIPLKGSSELNLGDLMVI